MCNERDGAGPRGTTALGLPDQQPVSGSEDDVIKRLFDSEYNYRKSHNNVAYACKPEENAPIGHYRNSNSFAAGLMLSVGFPLPPLPVRNPSLFPGWSVPLPQSCFQAGTGACVP